MKNIRTLLIAVSALALINVANAQTSASANASATAPGVTSVANAPYSADPLVQKRQADSIAKAEYKASKKAAKRKMKAEKKAAKAAMKAEKSEASAIRDKAIATEAK